MNKLMKKYRHFLALSSSALLLLIVVGCTPFQPAGMMNGGEGMGQHNGDMSSMTGSDMHGDGSGMMAGHEEMDGMHTHSDEMGADMHGDGSGMMSDGVACSEEEMHADGSGCGAGHEGMDEEYSGMGVSMMSDMQEMMARHHATIPDEYADLSNPVAADDASIERGAAVYAASCASCHGEQGMGDGPLAQALSPAPAVLAHTGTMMSDSYLFWRISEGGGGDPFNSAMPSWNGSIDEQSRWDLINYIQTLNR